MTNSESSFFGRSRYWFLFFIKNGLFYCKTHFIKMGNFL